jgi:hypothetical protein
LASFKKKTLDLIWLIGYNDLNMELEGNKSRWNFLFYYYL